MNVFKRLFAKKHNSDKIYYPRIYIKCKQCSGIYDIDWYDDEIYVRCSNYPKCTSTLNLADLVLEYIKKYGFNIFRWEKVCYRCKKKTYVYSYYLHYDLESLASYFDGHWNVVGLGDLSYVDNMLSEQIDTIKICYSKTTHSSYMANTCQHCGALQGGYFVVDDPHEIFDELFTHNMGKFFYKRLRFEDVSPLKNDIERLYNPQRDIL